MRYILTILILIFGFTSFSQKTFRVKHRDPKYMYEQGAAEWIFKDDLPDGHYYSYAGTTDNLKSEVTIKNGKREGIERRFNYATIMWRKGKKNGREVHYNGNGTIEHLLNFKNGLLHGYCEINWSKGEKNYNGFYKNDYRDSIWTYYNLGSLDDTSNYWISRQYKYDKGKAYLIFASNQQGTRRVLNGEGTVTDTAYYISTTTYEKGLKNGREVTTNPNGTTHRIRMYKNDLVTNETTYYDSNKVAFISEWNYPLPVRIDTAKAWIDTYITNIFYNEITYDNTPVRNGHWEAYFPNGTKIYEGNYLNGKRIGKWNWFYSNGKQRIVADLTTNCWQHFDTVGNMLSTITDEYLTPLINGDWFINQALDTTVLILTKDRWETITPYFRFDYYGHLQMNYLLECGKDVGETLGSYFLVADTLTINVETEPSVLKQYKYRLMSASDDKVTMERVYD